MVTIESNIEDLPNIGPAYQKKLKSIGIETVRDLLYYFPIRYNDFSTITPITNAKKGEIVCIQGVINEIGTSRTFRKWMYITEAIVQDDSETIRVIWFNQPYLEKSLKEGDVICLAGKITMGKGGIYMSNPTYEKISGEYDDTRTLTHTGRIVPVYSETKGLTSRWLRFAIKPLLAAFYKSIPESLPPEIIKKQRFLPIGKALWQAHFPDSFEAADAAKARFAFEELFLLQISVLRQKAMYQLAKAPACLMDPSIMKQFTDSLPFKLTDSQKQCAWQILKDMEKPFPMSRLLQGDVGSGKTVVATMAAISAIKNGYQAAFMAPTEILAKQHFHNITNLLAPCNVSIGLSTGKESVITRDGKRYEVKKTTLLEDLKNGTLDLLIGTHALIQKETIFKHLALVVVDEQHRFGVSQRSKLVKNKDLVPHLLSMTATPIPRTLALTVYGDLDLSLIKEMPKNRKKVKTFVVDVTQRAKAYEFIRKEAKEGRGIFVICPKIEKSQANNYQSPTEYHNQMIKPLSELKAVKEEYEKLSKEIFPDLKIAMLHGKMKPKEKESLMIDFRDGKIDILVSTSVVEVGVDVPRATVMMIEGAERFGLAQLHQFRGRVGRSEMQSYCFLFTTEQNQQHRKRLKAMETINSGFDLAQKDLQIRGPGQVYGTQQWGLPDMAMQGMSNIFLVEKTRAAARDILERDFRLQQYPLLKERVKQFEERIHFE